ncbi:MAG: DUF1800 domain-containing protein [Candidatus Tectomicrobia bacterium]|uniref:DUF1800 domain-containing protein n=1 Tax=Tectimicrobiota bacterium TaxID=2528274 RepID=A0A937VXS6_UNCTE|nr:DUF1800 domain-containing protein [Candidatus Tectomicrobia bacterium]
MASEDLALMAHLMRRAGFGASRDELEARVTQGYEATVEELLNPSTEPVDRYDFLRYHPGFWKPITSPGMGSAAWFHTMLNTQRPLEEKMVLFWHQVFATGQSKIDHWHELIAQADMLRDKGMGNYRDLLVALAQNPAMIYWLDNCDNHAHAVNENWGRELLELFSMGVGNYTETDVREASRAFTGWTIAPVPPRGYYNRWDWSFEYLDADHDEGDKTFLGHTGNFNGEDIIDIIVQQPACHRFIARHLYNFFVADEPQVPAWQTTPPQDPEAIDILAKAFVNSNYDMRAVLRVLFLSDFFKNARFTKIKSPAEVVIGLLRLAGGDEFPSPGIGNRAKQPTYMGQELLNPPSVEGWHTGAEWINSGTLMKRVNFAAGVLGDFTRPGMQAILQRLRAQGDLEPAAFVDSCLDLLGPLHVEPEVRQNLLQHASEGGPLRWGTADEADASQARLKEMFQLIASVREFQYC